VTDSFAQDVRFSLRALGRRPLFTAAALASLGVGCLAVTVVMSVVNAALFKPLPGVTRTERLVEIHRSVQGEATDVTYEVFRALQNASALEELAAYALVSSAVAADRDPVVRAGMAVTANYFSLLGTQPALGRLFHTSEAEFPSVAPVAVISHDVWQREFGGAGDVIGRVARVNGGSVEVIGVLPPGASGHATGLLVDVFLPLGLELPGLPRPTGLREPNASSLELVGRLAPGVSAASAATLLASIADRVTRETAGARNAPTYRLEVADWGPLPSVIRRPVALFLSILLVLVGLSLALACVNITTILLARAVDRQRELAVRRALGATSWRVARQLATEVVVLFAIAALLGIVGAAWIAGLMDAVVPPVPLPGRLGSDLSIDWRVVAASLGVSFAMALVASVAPALQGRRQDVVTGLRDGFSTEGRGRHRLRGALVGMQVAATTVLLVATGLFARSLATMQALRPAWNVDGVTVSALDLELNGTTREEGLMLQREVRRRLQGLPGVEAAAWATKLPIGGRSSFGPVTAVGNARGQTDGGVAASVNRVSADYFRAMGIRLTQGRDFDDTDRDGAPRVAIVTPEMAGALWPGREPVGQRFALFGGEQRIELLVIGVAGDSRLGDGRRPMGLHYYVPLAQWYNAAAVLHVRAQSGHATAVAAAAKASLRELSASLPIPEFRPLHDAMAIMLLPQRLATWVAACMGAFGLLLAALGIYGVAAMVAARQAREMAIRIALGATSGHVVRLMVSRGVGAPLIGVAIGLALAAALSFGASQVVAGVRPADPLALLLAVAAVGSAVAIALWHPVRRQLARHPMAVLREE